MRKRIIVLGLLSVIAVATLKCSPAYVLRAGIEEGKILSRRQPIDRVVRDPKTPDATRAKLRLVQQARSYAVKALELKAGDSYTTYSTVDHDTLLLVVSASRKDRFELVTWWFPIVGHVPYKGFFKPKDALDAAKKLEERGLDTYVRPSGAFSTLGWFNDPLLSTILRYDDVSLVATVIHELTHNTIFVPSQVPFNESFASFVGDRGAIAYFCGIEGAAGERCQLAEAYWSDNLVFGAFLQGLVRALDALYARTDLSSEAKVAARDEVIAAERRRFKAEVEPQLRTPAFRGFDRRPINNASLIARRLYFDRLDRFEAVFQAYDRDLLKATKAIQAAVADAPDPWQALEGLTGKAQKASTPRP
jgi:predicted aminopeptidase